MISYIKGELAEVMEDRIVVETGNIGYNIRVPLSLLEGIPRIGQEVKIYTYFYVREDAMSLFGFLSRNDLEIFRLLIGVNGVGPKGALGILSALSPDNLRMAIFTEDAKGIAKAPGIGAKTAQRIILDLKDKLKPEDVFTGMFDGAAEENSGHVHNQVMKETIEALVALGYSGVEASKAVKQADVKENMTVGELLKASLKNLTFL